MTAPTTLQHASARALDAVVIGCSAGGLDALRVLLGALPAQFEACVMVVAHGAPTGPSLLPNILAGVCPMPVHEAVEREPALPGHIYIAPPNYHLLIEPDRSFALSVDERVCYVRPAADVLFFAAARVYRERLAGVVLTGANSDGALGLFAIKKAGGLTLVQEPVGAYADTMPLAAIAAGAANRVLSLPDIARELMLYCSLRNAP